MAKRKNKYTFILDESNGVVVADLRDEHDYSLHHTISGMPTPRVRAPRLSKEEIESWAVFWGNGVNYPSKDEYLRKTIKSMNHEINKHVQEIRKSLKRMQSLTHYIVTAEEIIAELEKENLNE